MCLRVIALHNLQFSRLRVYQQTGIQKLSTVVSFTANFFMFTKRPFREARCGQRERDLLEVKPEETQTSVRICILQRILRWVEPSQEFLKT